MSDITEEDVMKYCQSRNLMLVTKESLEYMHRPIVIENAPTVNAIPIEWLINKCNEADNMGMGIDDWSVKDCYQLVLEQWEKENE